MGEVKVAEELRLLKAEALEKGELTDTTFLVGRDGETELVHCSKFDLLVASEYFRALFRSPLTGPPPIRMKHVQPHIFKLLIKHISTYTITKDLPIEDAIDLAHAADEFLLDSLKSYYIEEIDKMVNVGNVWQILNEASSPEVLSLIDKVLSTKTRECIAHDSFLEASQESLEYLLELNGMNVMSETELIDACFKLAYSKPTKERYALMKAALPHLRLLTLKVEQIPLDLLKYLSESERAHLLKMIIMCSSGKKADSLGNLCPCTEPRKLAAASDFANSDVIIAEIRTRRAAQHVNLSKSQESPLTKKRKSIHLVNGL